MIEYRKPDSVTTDDLSSYPEYSKQMAQYIELLETPNIEIEYGFNKSFIIHFTHNDGDGVACAIVSDFYNSRQKKRVIPIFCTTKDINQRIFKYIVMMFQFYHLLILSQDNTLSAENYEKFFDIVLHDEQKKSIYDDIMNSIFQKMSQYDSSDEFSNNESKEHRLPIYYRELLLMFPELLLYYNQQTSYDYRCSKIEDGFYYLTEHIIWEDNLTKINVYFPSSFVITDVILDETNIQLLDFLKELIGIDILYIDHHASNPFDNNKYEWGHVSETYEGEKAAACYQYMTYMNDNTLKTCVLGQPNNFLSQLVGSIIVDASDYDVWRWAEKTYQKDYSDCTATSLTALIANSGYYKIHGHIGKLIAINNLFYDLRETIFTAESNIKRLGQFEKYDRIIKAYNANMMYAELKGIHDCVLLCSDDLNINGLPTLACCALIPLTNDFVNNTMSGVCNTTVIERYIPSFFTEGSIQEREVKVDIVIGFELTSNKISLRRGTTVFDLGKIASKYFSGGGHPDAAGGYLSDEQHSKIVNYYIEHRYPKK